jgi:hypothetical protein
MYGLLNAFSRESHWKSHFPNATEQRQVTPFLKEAWSRGEEHLREVQPELYELYNKVRKSKNRQELEGCLYGQDGNKVYDNEDNTNSKWLLTAVKDPRLTKVADVTNFQLPHLSSQSTEASTPMTAIQRFDSPGPIYSQLAPEPSATTQEPSYPPAFSLMGSQFPVDTGVTSYFRGPDTYMVQGPVSVFAPVGGRGSMQSESYHSSGNYGYIPEMHPAPHNPAGRNFPEVHDLPMTTTIRYSALCDHATEMSMLFNQANSLERLSLLKSLPEFFLAIRNFVNENEKVIESMGVTVCQTATHPTNHCKFPCTAPTMG